MKILFSIVFLLIVQCSFGQTAEINTSTDSLKIVGVTVLQKKDSSFRFRTVCAATGTKKMLPLYVIDGRRTASSKIKELNPNAIESINILKGTEATKKYGKRGKYGVILITTKKVYTSPLQTPV